MIIVIAGPSGSGKTTLAKKIAKQLKIPVIHKDDIKETLYDVLGCDNLKTSRDYDEASYKIFYNFAKEQISNGNDIILESNFKPQFDEKIFKKFKETYNINSIQIRCITNLDIAVERFKKRILIDRHPGHNDHLLTDTNLRKGMEDESLPLEINCPIIEVNTNDFTTINYKEIFDKIKKYVKIV